MAESCWRYGVLSNDTQEFGNDSFFFNAKKLKGGDVRGLGGGVSGQIVRA